MDLYHYYDETIGPFRNLSDLSEEEARQVMRQIAKDKPGAFCNQRPRDYMQNRLYYEEILRREFQKKGGCMKRKVPHYMVVEECAFLESWYEHPACIKIPIEAFDKNTISFTYGDSHPTFSPRMQDGKEYRGKLYLYDEIVELIGRYGMPQVWNADGKYGPERYIEAHIWSDDVLRQYIEV